MCNCSKKPGFKQKLDEAQALTTKTGQQHVVFYMKAVDTLFVDKEESLNDELGICCYFVPDGTKNGTEKEYIPSGEVNQMEVAETAPEAAPVSDMTATLDVPDDEYKDFVDNGHVSKERIKSIAKKVKGQEALDVRENAIFVANTDEVEAQIKKLK